MEEENMINRLNTESVIWLLEKLYKSIVCPGNNFPELVAERHQISEFRDASGNLKAVIQNDMLSNPGEYATIRHVNCSVIIPEKQDRCQVCQDYRNVLKSMVWRVRKKEKENVNLSRIQLEAKAANLYKEVKYLRRSIQSLEKNIKESIDTEGCTSPADIHDICSATVNTNNCGFDTESVQYLLWSQQKKQASMKDPRSMKWHPLMIRWCIAIYLKSPSA